MKPPVQFLPVVGVRVAGESAALISSDGRTVALLASIREREAAMRQTASVLVSQIESLVPQLDDVTIGRSLLQAKRDVFNLRSIRRADFDRLQHVVPVALLESLAHFNQALTDLQQQRDAVAAAYEGELAAGEAGLRALCRRPNLSKAISYTHPELYAELLRLAQAENHRMDGKKRRNLEDTLLQYALRCSTKISPLSSFTAVHFGPWAQQSDTSLDVAFRGATTSHIEMKAALSSQLIEPLLKRYAIVRDCFPLRLNPTIALDDDKLSWRIVATGSLVTGRTWGTAESVVQSKDNGVIRCIRHVFSRTETALTADDLITEVCRLAPKLTLLQVDHVVKQLFDSGMLLPVTGIFEQQDPLSVIISVVERVGAQHTSDCMQHLERVRSLLGQFGEADAAERTALINGMRQAIDEIASALGAEVSPKVAHNTFFENCYLQAPSQALSVAALEPFRNDLALLLEVAPLLDLNQRIMSDMADCFLADFGKDGCCDDVEGFIRRFEARYRPGVFFQTNESNDKAAPSTITQRQLAAGDAFIAMVADALNRGNDTSLDREAIGRVLDMLPPEIRKRSVSHSFLGQICRNDGRSPKLVVNQILGGRAGMMSRFLESIDDAALTSVRQYLKASGNYGRYAALPGVYGFNANRHPRMADEEISVGAFGASWQDTAKLPLRAMQLDYDPALHRVSFKDEQGVPLDVWYQGFLIPSLLPPVQRTLALALSNGHINFSFSALMDGGVATGDRVTVLPRISLGDVVLMRRTHVFPTPFLPQADVSPLEFFLSFQSWWEASGLSASFYVRLLPLDSDPAANESWWNLNPKDMKPFFVRHDNPRLVRLLQRAMKKNRLPLFITEALPNLDDQHVTVAGESRVAEVHFEMSRAAVATDETPKPTARVNDLVEA